MEELENYLLDDEEILWSHREMMNLIQLPTLEIIIGTSLSGGLSLSLNFIIYVFFAKNIILLLSLIILPIVIVIIFGLSLIMPGIRQYIQITENLHLNTKDLRKYEGISIITNKRLIQKSYNAFEIDYLQNPINDLENFKIYRDMVFVNLESIQVVSAEEMEYFFQVGFKFKEDDTNFMPLLFSIPRDRFSEFLSILKENIPLQRKIRISNYIINYYKN